MRTTRRPIDSKAYENYYLRQVGQGMPVFEGANLQRGYGLGGILSGLLRSAVPLLKPLLRQGAKALGKHAMKTGVSIAQDALAGQNFKSSAKRRLKETGRVMGRQAVSRMTGSGKRRQKQSKKKSIKRKRTGGTRVISRQCKRRRRSADIFDY